MDTALKRNFNIFIHNHCNRRIQKNHYRSEKTKFYIIPSFIQKLQKHPEIYILIFNHENLGAGFKVI